MNTRKRTPCVGICSTTYGDLVCRGCKRFAHEIVEWNGYEDVQREQIWTRLTQIRNEVMAVHLEIDNRYLFQVACEKAYIKAEDDVEAMYQLLRYVVSKSDPLPAVGLGLVDAQAYAGMPDDAVALEAIRRIDADIYAHAQAHYERNFKIPV